VITKNIVSAEEMLVSIENKTYRHVINGSEIEEPIILTEEEKIEFTNYYTRAIGLLESYIPPNTPNSDVTVNLYPFHDTGGRQLIADGDVSDMTRKETNQYNWHLQNTSRWLFGMGFVFDKEKHTFSLHT